MTKKLLEIVRDKNNTPTVVPISNRSFQFGDGIFETCKVQNHQILLQDYHLERLKLGVKRLKIRLDFDTLLLEIDEFLKTLKNGGVKIIISRGESLQGYATNNLSAKTIIYDFPLPQPVQNMSLNFCNTGYYSNPNLTGIKHQNRLEQILARNSSSDGNDCIMLDEKNNIISTTSANIFSIKDNVIYTPNLDNCGILGTRRAYLLDNLEISIKDISPQELLHADEVFITNATFGIVSVKNIEDIIFDNTITNNIKQTLHL